ncbi:hypothetical protein K501DRAFT_235163 [Backusella circina FSU 941]|nr:hypothetical protein K501DRAFT_235163 [Backusella circina FSU 941]
MNCFKITPIQSLQTLHLPTPGINSEAAALSEKLLSEIHEKFDVFLSERKTHNHSMHHILASLSLGASPEQIQVIFEQHIDTLRAVPQTLTKVTRDNYKDYLNKAEAYTSFFDFFTCEIDEYGVDETVRRWVWSGDLLTRTIGGLFHPFIHIGYGLEFKLPGMVAEGLSMACCTGDSFQPLTSIQPSLNRDLLSPLTTSAAFNVGSPATNQPVDKSTINKDSEPQGSPTSLYHFLDKNPLIQTIIEIQKDAELDIVKPSMLSKRIQTIATNPESMSKIKKYLDKWEIEATPESIHENYKSLFECILIVYGASAFGPKDRDNDDRFMPDFVLMHALTSVYFIYFYLRIIDPSEAVSLLHEHWSSTVFHYIATGRPYLNLDKLLEYRKDLQGNDGWDKIIDDSLVCQEAHVVKSVRSLAFGQLLFGSKESEMFSSLWVKVAHMGIVKDGKWSFDGLGFTSTWEP